MFSVQDSGGFRVAGFRGLWVYGLGCAGLGLGLRLYCTPAPPPCNMAFLGYAVCENVVVQLRIEDDCLVLTAPERWRFVV